MTRTAVLTSAFAIPFVGLFFVAAAKGQFGGAQSRAVNDGVGVKNASYTQGFSEIVTVSRNGDAVWLFSYSTSRWHKQAIPADEGVVIPTIGMGVVAFRTRTKAYACSSQTGVWDSVDLGETRGQPTVGSRLAVFRAGNKLHGFSAETGKWDSIELGPDDVGQPTVGSVAVLETGSRIYAFSSKGGNWDVVDRDKPENP